VKANLPAALAAVIQHEGGFVNDPRDPGGATNRGITQAVYDDWRASHGLPLQSVRNLVNAEVEAIYRTRYWDAIRGDDLPSGVDYCTFDFAVNSGVNRASRFLQNAAGVTADGKIGPVTLAAVAAIPPLLLIRAVCAARLDFLHHLETFDRFGRGWTARVNEVRDRAEALA
jgi:lysozyme family protein